MHDVTYLNVYVDIRGVRDDWSLADLYQTCRHSYINGTANSKHHIIVISCNFTFTITMKALLIALVCVIVVVQGQGLIDHSDCHVM